MKLSTDVRALGLAAMTFLAVTLFVGCGGSKTTMVVPSSTATIGLPTPATAGAVNVYTGGQNPGEWTFTLNNTANTFSYNPVTYTSAATTGSLQTSGGFASLGASGLAYEILGRVAILRPGDSMASPIFAVPQTECYAITGKVRFQYLDLFPGAYLTDLALDPLAYGSVVASTDTTGKTWQFENLQSGNKQSVSYSQLVVGPSTFTGSCTTADSQASITMPNTTMLNTYWSMGLDSSYMSWVVSYMPLPSATESKIWIGPSGFFAADQSDPDAATDGFHGKGASVAGIAEPSAALSTSTLAAGQYLGFLHERPSTATSLSNTTYSASSVYTMPVGFGQVVTGSGTIMTGGIFPSNAVTGTPNSDIQINLGKQDSTYNGLYPSATITVLDPSQNCSNVSGVIDGFSQSNYSISTGVNADGYITCTFPAVAIAGNPDGKYAIFVHTYNWADQLGGVSETFFLFQQ